VADTAHPLASKVVVITGASAGVGRALTLAFARVGARLALLARGAGGLEGARRDAENAGAHALAIRVDVADADAVFAAADRIEAELGPIDVWVNNAMATVFSRVEDLTPAELRRATEVTYFGAVYGTLAALGRMKKHGRGTIVQVGSALAYRAIPLQAAYCAAKHALQGFTDALRCELIHDEIPIHVTSVHLPAINTPQFDWSRSHFSKRPQPVPPIFQPEVAADAIVWAAHNRRRELWVGLPTYQTILGNRVAPALMDRILASKAFDGQLTDEDEPPGRPDNLFEPVEGNFGAHGRFDDRASDRSWLLPLTKHRLAVALTATVVIVVVLALIL
jgi:NAD(P)-dependent dehydrogenase (short-subunit alcohol dehydrogenase family)